MEISGSLYQNDQRASVDSGHHHRHHTPRNSTRKPLQSNDSSSNGPSPYGINRKRCSSVIPVNRNSNVPSPNYLRASTGSCHDFCKFGTKTEFERPWRSIRKQSNSSSVVAPSPKVENFLLKQADTLLNNKVLPEKVQEDEIIEAEKKIKLFNKKQPTVVAKPKPVAAVISGELDASIKMDSKMMVSKPKILKAVVRKNTERVENKVVPDQLIDIERTSNRKPVIKIGKSLVVPKASTISKEEKSSFLTAVTISKEEKSAFPTTATISKKEKSPIPVAATISRKEKSSFPAAGTISKKEKSSFPTAATISKKEKSSFLPVAATISKKENPLFFQAATISNKEKSSAAAAATISKKEKSSFPAATSKKKKSSSLSAAVSQPIKSVSTNRLVKTNGGKNSSLQQPIFKKRMVGIHEESNNENSLEKTVIKQIDESDIITAVDSNENGERIHEESTNENSLQKMEMVVESENPYVKSNENGDTMEVEESSEDNDDETEEDEEEDSIISDEEEKEKTFSRGNRPKKFAEDNNGDDGVKLKFRRGRVIDIQAEGNDSPRKLRFRRGRVENSAEGRSSVKRQNFRKKATIISKNNNEDPDSEIIMLRHQDVEEKKDAQGLFNNVIEETASKLVEARKSKVKALVGAFETVISLQETSSSNNTKQFSPQSSVLFS